jgi:hypothetical protein
MTAARVRAEDEPVSRSRSENVDSLPLFRQMGLKKVTAFAPARD